MLSVDILWRLQVFLACVFYPVGFLAKRRRQQCCRSPWRSLHSGVQTLVPTQTWILSFGQLEKNMSRRLLTPPCAKGGSSLSLENQSERWHLRTVHVISFHTVSTVFGRISRCQSLISYFTGLRFVTCLSKEPAVVITQGLAIIALTQN